MSQHPLDLTGRPGCWASDLRRKARDRQRCFLPPGSPSSCGKEGGRRDLCPGNPRARDPRAQEPVCAPHSTTCTPGALWSSGSEPLPTSPQSQPPGCLLGRACGHFFRARVRAFVHPTQHLLFCPLQNSHTRQASCQSGGSPGMGGQGKGGQDGGGRGEPGLGGRAGEEPLL